MPFRALSNRFPNGPAWNCLFDGENPRDAIGRPLPASIGDHRFAAPL